MAVVATFVIFFATWLALNFVVFLGLALFLFDIAKSPTATLIVWFVYPATASKGCRMPQRAV